MLSTFAAVLASICLSSVLSVETFGEEKQCFIDNAFGKCMSDPFNCQNKLPEDKKEALMGCFQGFQAPMSGIMQCLSDNGVTDGSPCFTKPESHDWHGGMSGGMRGGGGMGGGGNMVAMMRAFMTMKDFFGCMKDCMGGAVGQCTAGCAPASDATMVALKTCASQAQQSAGGGPMKCFMDAMGGRKLQ